MWVQHIFSIKDKMLLIICISEQDIILHEGQVIHKFNSSRKDTSTIPYNFYRKNIWGSISVSPCTCIGPTIILQSGIDPKNEVDPDIDGEEKCGGLSSMEVLLESLL